MNIAIDNLERIKRLLEFKDEHSFYMLYIFKRKKDQPLKVQNQHQSVRTIKSYCVESIEYLENRYEEIKQLCELFNARAYIHVQSQSHIDISYALIEELGKRGKNKQYRLQHIFDSVVGKLKTYEKRWVVDIDTKNKDYIQWVGKFIDFKCRPDTIDKVITRIPTKSGVHLITKRFDVKRFKEVYPDIDIQKKNPTVLYIPKSLMNI